MSHITILESGQTFESSHMLHVSLSGEYSMMG
jgi:hypothetical protein